MIHLPIKYFIRPREDDETTGEWSGKGTGTQEDPYLMWKDDTTGDVSGWHIQGSARVVNRKTNKPAMRPVIRNCKFVGSLPS